MTTRRWSGLGFLLAMAPAFVFALAHARAPALYDPRRDPAADLRAAMDTATREHKRILLVVGGDWCSWCRVLARTMHEEELARQIVAGFVVVKVNFSPQNPNRSFLSRFPEIAGYPHLFVLASDGSLLFSEDTGNLEQGSGYDHAKVAAFFKRWAPP